MVELIYRMHIEAEHRLGHPLARWLQLETLAAIRSATRPGLKCGICGEHGGDPASIKFCAVVGLNYVSCSPFRDPVARLVAAQAAKKK